MLARLRGIVIEFDDTGACVVDVNGVGYEVFVPMRVAARLPLGVSEPPVETTLHIHTHVREDAFTLYGFTTPDDRTAFRALMGVNGVGPRLALSVLSNLSAGELAVAIARGDKKRLQAISGVGKKLVERLMLELRDKLPMPTGAAARGEAPVATSPAVAASDPVRAATDALVQMGFSRGEAERAVAGIEPGLPVEVVLRKALASLA